MFSLGNGASSVEAWFSTALDIEEVLSGTGDGQLHVMVADVISPLTLLTGPFWTVLGVGWACLSGSSLRLVLENPGVRMVVFLKVVLLVWCSLWPCMSLGAVILRLCLMLSRNFMLIISSVVRSVLVPFFDAARFTAQYVRVVGQDVSLVSVSFSAPPSRLGGP